MKPEKDIYFQKAMKEGYLARSAYKLLQIDDVFNVLEDATTAIDLCSAPGSWTQVIYNKFHNVFNDYDASKLNPNAKIVSVDMMPMDHFPGVIHLEADISQYSTMRKILDEFNNEKVDVVVCDGACDGMKMLDYFMHHRIFLAALYVALNTLKVGGNFVMKIFIGKGHEIMVRKLRMFFSYVCIVKPHCSRNQEAFAVCRIYTPLTDFDPLQLTPFIELKNDDFSKLDGIHKKLIPYLCSDSYLVDEHSCLLEDPCEMLPEGLEIMNTILKQTSSYTEAFNRRLMTTLPVFRITQQNNLEYDPETFDELFGTKFDLQSVIEKTVKEIQENLRHDQDSEDGDNVTGSQHSEEIEEVHAEIQELAENICFISVENSENSSNNENTQNIEVVDGEGPASGRLDKEKVYATLAEKMKELKYRYGDAFDQNDWRFYVATPPDENVENEEVRRIYEDFDSIDRLVIRAQHPDAQLTDTFELYAKQADLQYKLLRYCRNLEQNNVED